VTVAVEKRRASAGIRIRAEKCRDAMQLVGSRSHQAVPIGRRRKTRVMAPASVLRRCPQCGCARGRRRSSLRGNELPLAESARLMLVTHCQPASRAPGAGLSPESRPPQGRRTRRPLRQPPSPSAGCGNPSAACRCASDARRHYEAAPVVTTRRKPRPSSDCGVQAQVTDPSDGLPAAAGSPGQPFLMTPPQAGFVVHAPNGVIDLAQPPEPRGAAHAAWARSVGRLATASVTEARAVPGRPGRRTSAQEREWCPASAMVPDSLRRSGRTETLTGMNDTHDAIDSGTAVPTATDHSRVVTATPSTRRPTQ
jgi:hypothetical protein